MKRSYQIIYNLSKDFYWFYLPTAYIADLNDEGLPMYARQRITLVNLSNFDISPTPTDRRLFQIMDLLTIPALEKKFNNKTRKRKKTIKQLLEIEDVKKQIQRYIHQKMDMWLRMIDNHDLPLCLELKRRDWVANKRILKGVKKLLPNLYFKKTENGVDYQLSLFAGEATWHIREKSVHILTNTPTWLIMDDKLYQVPHINGNMLRPFIARNQITIKKPMVKSYFQKFIVRIANKTNIVAEGFDIVQYTQLTKCELALMKNFFDDTYGLTVRFFYDKTKFDYKEKMLQKTQVEFKGTAIVMHQYRRNKITENQLIEQLHRKGLANTVGKYFNFENTEKTDTFELYNWLIEHKKELEQAGFTIRPPELDNKLMTLSKASLQLNLKQINDWFDIYGQIQVGDLVIPFQKLATYIKDNNRFYPLPNGAFFLIPAEWMARYQSVFQLGKVKTNVLRLTKSQFPVIKNLNLAVKSETTNPLEQDFNEIQYQPSKLLKATLRPYQLEGVKWLIHLFHNQLGGCLADDMGLGKTIQTIALMLYVKEQRAKNKDNKPNSNSNIGGFQLNFFQQLEEITQSYPLNTLIIMPASLIFNWEKEIKKFAPTLSVYKHVGSKRQKSARLLPTFDIILTTYHTALKDTKILKTIDFEYIVLDESQQIKNKDSKIFKAINALSANYKVSLSGTPIENSLSDLWSQMQFINPDLLGTFRFFKQEFIIPIEKHNHERQKAKLRALTAPYLLRRTKEAVAKDLPPLTEKIFYSEMLTEQRQRYEKAKSKARNFLLDHFNKDKKFSTVVFQTLMRLRQIAIHPILATPNAPCPSGKFNDIIEHLAIIQKSGHKTLIFSQFVKHLNLYKQHFEQHQQQYAWLSGSTPALQREKAINQFEDNEAVRHFLISLKAGGTGLNLTAADYVFITDPWWNPSIERQAIARAHRIGQTKSVMAIKFITKDTIEEKILLLQAKKQQLAADMINYNDQFPFSREDLVFLLG